MSKIWIAILAALMVTACQTTEIPDERIGQLFQDEMVIGVDDTRLPLPPGQWELVATDKYYNAPGSRINGVMLVRVEGGKLTGLVKASASGNLSANGYVSSKFCNHSTVIAKSEGLNVAGGFQDCWAIMSWEMKRSEITSKMGETLYRHLDEKGIEYSSTLVTVGFRKTTKNKTMGAYYGFNPELEGIDRAQITRGPDSEWSPENFTKDTKKIAMVERLKNWAESWDQKVSAAFNSYLPNS